MSLASPAHTLNRTREIPTDPPVQARGPAGELLAGVLDGEVRVERMWSMLEWISFDDLSDPDEQTALWSLHRCSLRPRPGTEHLLTDRTWRDVYDRLDQRFGIALERLAPRPVDSRAVGDHLRKVLSRPSVDSAAAAALHGSNAVLEILLAKAPYLLAEADPHTLALASLGPRIQHVMAEIQAGEYGVGFDSTHSEIYQRCLEALDVSPSQALDTAPAESFAFSNAAWHFGRNPHRRGAAVGQLCYLELDSVEPSRANAEAWNRVGLPETGRRWYDVHVLADAEHAEIVSNRLIPAVENSDPVIASDATWGVDVTHALLRLQSEALLDRWGG